jgi:hypothetical protein
MATESVTTPIPARRDCRKSYRDNIIGIPAGTGLAHVALSIATAYPHRLPTWQELAGRFGMSRATAYRHVATLRAVRGEG